MRPAALAALALVLVGCAQPRWSYEKRGATPAQLDRDLVQCRREAFRPQRFALRVSERYDWEALNRCMERRGYTARPEED